MNNIVSILYILNFWLYIYLFKTPLLDIFIKHFICWKIKVLPLTLQSFYSTDQNVRCNVLKLKIYNTIGVSSVDRRLDGFNETPHEPLKIACQYRDFDMPCLGWNPEKFNMIQSPYNLRKTSSRWKRSENVRIRGC